MPQSEASNRKAIAERKGRNRTLPSTARIYKWRCDGELSETPTECDRYAYDYQWPGNGRLLRSDYSAAGAREAVRLVAVLA